MNPTLQAQASQAAQQGQQLLTQFQGQSDAAKTNYDTYTGQAADANKNLQDETTYMQGEGSGENTYNRTLDTQKTAAGWNPQQLSDANKTLFQLTGAMNGTNAQFSQPGGVGAYGMSAPALASYEGSILNPLTTGVSNANTQVGALNAELGTLETGANQATSSQVQSEQNTATALSQAVVNYQSMASSALQNMQFYSQLAQQQGGLNATEQQNYAQAEQAYASAQQAIAQSKLILSQTTGQNLTNTAMQNQLKVPAAPVKNAGGGTPQTGPVQSNNGTAMGVVGHNGSTPIYGAQF